MKLITELNEEVEFITETKESGDKDYFIVGRYMTANEPNKNGRLYEKKTLEKEVERYIREVVNAKRALGELNHPQGPTINLDRVSHIITELTWDGNYVNGKAKLTETPMGDIAKGLLKSGCQLGVSTRGMGSLKESNGVMVVQPDFKLSTVDIVSDPSGPGCFVNGIMENVEWIYDPVKGTWFEEKLHETKKTINKMSIREIEEKKFAIFEDYISSLAVKNYKI
jgi:Prohead core protein serine protease